MSKKFHIPASRWRFGESLSESDLRTVYGLPFTFWQLVVFHILFHQPLQESILLFALKLKQAWISIFCCFLILWRDEMLAFVKTKMNFRWFMCIFLSLINTNLFCVITKPFLKSLSTVKSHQTVIFCNSIRLVHVTKYDADSLRMTYSHQREEPECHHVREKSEKSRLVCVANIEVNH